MTASTAARLRDMTADSTERNVAMWTHLSPLLAFLVVGPLAFVPPLILWLVRKDVSAFDDDHGREVMNMSITGFIVFVVGMLTGIVMVFWVFWLVVILIATIRGAMAASAGEYFRYPMTIRLL